MDVQRREDALSIKEDLVLWNGEQDITLVLDLDIPRGDDRAARARIHCTTEGPTPLRARTSGTQTNWSVQKFDDTTLSNVYISQARFRNKSRSPSFYA